ncbi:MAG: hypothetical protein Q9181_000860 [Wetmoreana brouardii]
MNAFDTARQDFLANLGPDERSLLASGARPEDVLADIRRLDEQHQKQSILRRIMRKLEPSIRGFEQYASAMDVLINAKPEGLWKPVKREFESTISRLEKAVDDVMDEADLAEKEAASLARTNATAQARFEEHRTLFEWLDPVDPCVNYQKAVSVHETHTGRWFLSSPEFETWFSAKNGVLWLHAKPGAGKTIMASTVITYLCDRALGTDTTVLYYFCDYKNPKTQHPKKAIETLLASLCRKNDQTLAFMADLCKRHREVGSSCSVDELLRAFLKCLAMIGRTYVVIDALDECNDRHDLIKLLLDVVRSAPRSCLLMTSREIFDIQESMQRFPNIGLRASDMALDIEAYVSGELRRLLDDRKLKIRDLSLVDKIQTTLISKADGMFQWVKCQFDMLCSCISDRRIYDTLQSVPKGLDETYIRILARIRQESSGDIYTIKRMFFWLVHSLRPLTIAELAEAITLHPGQEAMDFSAVATEPVDLLQFSGGLITTMEDGETVGLAHFSIKEFFLSHRIQESSVSEFYAGDTELQIDMTKTCLNYLMMSDFATGQCHSIKRMESRLGQYQFLRYVAGYWFKHYQNLPDSHIDTLIPILLAFFTHPNYVENVLSWQQIEDHLECHGATDRWGQEEIHIVTALNPIYNAAHYGLAGLVEPLCQMGYNVNERGGHYGYPLRAAARHKRHGPAIITTLISMNADINVLDYHASLALDTLLQASENWDFLKDLVRHGLQLGSRANWTSSSIIGQIAEHPSDAFQMVEFLLDNGAEMDDLANYPDDYGYYPHSDRTGPPLQLACRRGNLKVTELLLRHGARSNYSFCLYGTPLHSATLGKHKHIINLLLEFGVEIDAVGGCLGSPLQAAAWNGDQDLVFQLLERGSNVNVGGGYFGSALAAAIDHENHAIANILLKHDADPNGGDSPCDSGLLLQWWEYLDEPRILARTSQPIIGAIGQGNTDLVCTLLERGADLNGIQYRCQASLHAGRAQDYSLGVHPLCQAIESDDHSIVELLISKGADPFIGHFCAALVAVKKGNIQLLQGLMDTKPFDHTIGSALLDALILCQDDATSRLLIKLINNKPFQPILEDLGVLLGKAIERNLEQQVSWLLEKGVSPNFLPSRRTETSSSVSFLPSFGLPLAISLGHFAIANDLIRHGADLNVCHFDKGTPLFAAFRKRNVDLVRDLLQRGARIDTASWSFVSFPTWRHHEKCLKLIHHVAAAGDMMIMDLLLEYGADLNTRCDLCETAIWIAVQNEDTNMIQFLVRNGADVNDCNMYGKPLLQWAAQNHLINSYSDLERLGALTNQDACVEKVEKSVRWLCKELSPRMQTEPWPAWVPVRRPVRRWVMLARCLFLGDDQENAVIALEQTIRKVSFAHEHDDDKTGEWPTTRSRIGCSKCGNRYLRGRIHLCKDSDSMGICEECLITHERELQQEGMLDEHEYLMYPGPFFSSAIPEDHVALGEGLYVHREEWLDSLSGWKAKEKAATKLPYRLHEL